MYATHLFDLCELRLVLGDLLALGGELTLTHRHRALLHRHNRRLLLEVERLPPRRASPLVRLRGLLLLLQLEAPRLQHTGTLLALVSDALLDLGQLLPRHVAHVARILEHQLPTGSKAVESAALEAASSRQWLGAQCAVSLPWYCRGAQSRQARPEETQEPSVGTALTMLSCSVPWSWSLAKAVRSMPSRSRG